MTINLPQHAVPVRVNVPKHDAMGSVTVPTEDVHVPLLQGHVISVTAGIDTVILPGIPEGQAKVAPLQGGKLAHPVEILFPLVNILLFRVIILFLVVTSISLKDEESC